MFRGNDVFGWWRWWWRGTHSLHPTFDELVIFSLKLGAVRVEKSEEFYVGQMGVIVSFKGNEVAKLLVRGIMGVVRVMGRGRGGGEFTREPMNGDLGKGVMRLEVG